MNDEPGKQGKGRGALWPWLLIGGGITAYFAWKVKKKADVEKARKQREQELLREQEEAQKGGPGEVPGSTLNLPLEGQFSASDRLKGMGIDPSKPAHYQERGDPYAG